MYFMYLLSARLDFSPRHVTELAQSPTAPGPHGINWLQLGGPRQVQGRGTRATNRTAGTAACAPPEIGLGRSTVYHLICELSHRPPNLNSG